MDIPDRCTRVDVRRSIAAVCFCGLGGGSKARLEKVDQRQAGMGVDFRAVEVSHAIAAK